METRCVLLKLCAWLALLTSTAESQNCPSDYRFLIQPPSELNCNPLGQEIVLECNTEPITSIVTWYWTQNVCEAGINGTAILPGDRDNYLVISIDPHHRSIHFTASESTLGYYWCEISNAVNVSLRPSIITPVLQPTNMSLPACTNSFVEPSHINNPECAEEDSPTVHSRLPLPSSQCSVFPQLTSSFNTTPTISVDLQTSTAPIPTLVPSVASSAGLQTLLDSTSTSMGRVPIPFTASTAGTSTVAILTRTAQFPVSSSAELLSPTNSQRLQTLMDSTSTSTVTVTVPPTTSSLGSSTIIIIVVIAVAVFIVLTALGLVLLLVFMNFRRRRMAKSSARSITGTLNDDECDMKMIQNDAFPTIPSAQDKMSQSENYYEFF